MRKTILTFSVIVVSCCFNLAYAQQEIWAAYMHQIDIKDYKGKRFRVEASIRTELVNDSASARIWARVDKGRGMGFFDNMGNRPVRDSQWKTYTINGVIDTAATSLTLGMLVVFNGSFYFDNVKVSVETKKNKWATVFADDFEKGDSQWHKGIGSDQGKNSLFTSSIATGNGHSFKIEGKGVPDYGTNKKAGKFANVNGIKLYYEIYGEGPPLVVLHGNGGSITNATPQYPFLIKKYKVIAIDSRAQGKSTDTDAALTYDLMASDVSALLDQLNIDSAYVWGQSDGAILGLVLAMDHPKKVKKVLAFGSNIQPDSSAIFGWAVEDAIKKSTSENAKERKLNKLMADYPNIPYSKLSSIKIPVLVMSGDRDVIRPEHTLKIFQSIPNSQLCIIPGATHGASWEKMDLFLQIAADFFDKPFTMPDTKDWYN